MLTFYGCFLLNFMITELLYRLYKAGGGRNANIHAEKFTIFFKAKNPTVSF